MIKIPNTNLTLSEAEIQAVVDFAYNRSMNNNKSSKDEEFEIPAKFRGSCKPGRMKKIYGNNPPVPEYFTPVNNDVV